MDQQADRVKEIEERVAQRKHFGARLRSLRHECGWSVEEASLRVGCSTTHYYKLEEGAKDFTSSMLIKLGRAFRLDQVDFFTFPEASPLRHGIFELLRKAPEPVLLRMKLFLLEELERQPKAASTEVTNDDLKTVRHHKRAAR